MNKAQFIDLLNKYYQQFKNVDKLCEIFDNAFTSPIVEYGWEMFTEVLKAYFIEEGVDWIEYFLYENPEKCYYEDDKRIPLETLDDLWNLVKDYLK